MSQDAPLMIGGLALGPSTAAATPAATPRPAVDEMAAVVAVLQHYEDAAVVAQQDAALLDLIGHCYRQCHATAATDAGAGAGDEEEPIPSRCVLHCASRAMQALELIGQQLLDEVHEDEDEVEDEVGEDEDEEIDDDLEQVEVNEEREQEEQDEREDKQEEEEAVVDDRVDDQADQKAASDDDDDGSQA